MQSDKFLTPTTRPKQSEQDDIQHRAFSPIIKTSQFRTYQINQDQKRRVLSTVKSQGNLLGLNYDIKKDNNSQNNVNECGTVNSDENYQSMESITHLKRGTTEILYRQNSGDYHKYWKGKAYQYQKQNFQLQNRNAQLRQQIQKLKQIKYKGQTQNQKLTNQCQKIAILQDRIFELQKNEHHLHNRIKQIQRDLKISKHLVQKLQKMSNYYSKEIGNNDSIFAMFHKLREQNRRLEHQNHRYIYIIKQLEEQLKIGGSSSIWQNCLNMAQNLDVMKSKRLNHKVNSKT